MESPSINSKGNREQVMANLASIRVGKTKLLKMLSNLKQMEDKGDAIDKDMISKLVEAFDSLNKQEEDYIRVIREIIQKQVGEYAKEFHKSKSENQAEEGGEGEENTADDIIKEVDQIEKDAIAASEKHDFLISTIKQRLEKKKLLDQIHQIEDPQTDTKSDLVEKLELTKLRLANEKESVDRAEDIRNRLKREAIKRGYIKTDSSNAVLPPAADEIELGPDQRVPPVNNDEPAQPLDEEAKAEVHAKIQRHIDQIKARKQRMRECYAQAQEMMDLKKAYSDAVKRSNELESMHKYLEELKLENESKDEESSKTANETKTE